VADDRLDESLSVILCAGHNQGKGACYAKQSEESGSGDRQLPAIPKDLVAHFLNGPMSGEAIERAGAAREHENVWGMGDGWPTRR
jgi:hypothetical protein